LRALWRRRGRLRRRGFEVWGLGFGWLRGKVGVHDLRDARYYILCICLWDSPGLSLERGQWQGLRQVGGVDWKRDNSPFDGDGRCLPFDRAGSSNNYSNRRECVVFSWRRRWRGASRNTVDVLSHSLSWLSCGGRTTQHADYGHGFGKRAQVHGGVGTPMGLPHPGFFL
jgi:hypothetical protein